MALSLCALQDLFVQLYLSLRAGPKSAGGENDGHFEEENMHLRQREGKPILSMVTVVNPGRGQGQAKAK